MRDDRTGDGRDRADRDMLDRHLGTPVEHKVPPSSTRAREITARARRVAEVRAGLPSPPLAAIGVVPGKTILLRHRQP